MFNVDKEKIFWRKIEDETVILNIDTGFYYTLDELGSLIWDMALEQRDEREIVAHILDKYETSEETARRDIRALVVNLKKEELIT